MATDDLTYGLARHLAAHDGAGAGGRDQADPPAWRVDEVLRSSAAETTQVVSLPLGSGCTLGPFIRKLISTRDHLGQAYGRLYEAQRAGARFAHLPRVLFCGERDGTLEVVMEYLPGATLAETVICEGAGLATAQCLFPPVCDAVRELHERFAPPLIHRDIKPANVMVGPRRIAGMADGEKHDALASADLPEIGEARTVTLIDFGIARTFTPGAAVDTVRFGTRAYAPPEQFGYGQTDVRSDVYALGMMLYFLLVGREPSGALDAGALQDPSIPAGLRTVIARATAFDPNARYASVRELQQAFRGAVDACEVEMHAPAPVSAPVPAPASIPAQAPVASPRSSAAARPVIPAPPSGPESEPSRTLLQFIVSAGSAIRAAFRRIPPEVGVAWNTLLGLFLLALVGICIIAIVRPTGRETDYPLWFRVMEYSLLLIVPNVAMLYLMADRRRLLARIPVVSSWSFVRRFAVLMMAVFVSYAAVFAVAYACGIGV